MPWKITAFAAPEVRGWDHETGFPTVDNFGNAVQVWAVAQGRDVSILEAATAFNVAPAIVETAIEEHQWMYFTKGGMIGHDGE